MLKVILDNLINNAIKFTRKGSVNIDTGIDIIDNKTYFCIKIEDTGIGIKENELPLVFEEFKQLSEGFTKDFQGSGLGLSITKKYVELLNGIIRVESTFGIGTTFTIYFPTHIQAVA
jgi:signal transduction histidine kinase